eukprot:m.61354 g.61354  ORF g.61354 m.61354 type:complete len:61 (+) comp11858_c0_seq4:589-771(+)
MKYRANRRCSFDVTTLFARARVCVFLKVTDHMQNVCYSKAFTQRCFRENVRSDGTYLDHF